MVNRILLGLAFLLSGCALMPIHDVDVSDGLRRNPVHNIYIARPVFPLKFKRARSVDFQEMLPENQVQSAQTILSVFGGMLGNKVCLNFPMSDMPTDAEEPWINTTLNQLRKYVPLRVDPDVNPNFKPESVLFIIVSFYGYSDGQLVISSVFTGNKEFRVGPPKWYPECHLTAVLVRPSDGKILMSVEDKESSYPDYFNTKDPAMLDKILRKTIATFTDALPTTP